MVVLALLASSTLFGGMMLYSFGFAPLVFSGLPMDVAGRLLRFAFPHYYVFIIATAAIATLILLPYDLVSAGLMAATAALALFARQILMPMINFFRDQNENRNFNRAHFLSVTLNMMQLCAVATVLIRLS